MSVPLQPGVGVYRMRGPAMIVAVPWPGVPADWMPRVPSPVSFASTSTSTLPLAAAVMPGSSVAAMGPLGATTVMFTVAVSVPPRPSEMS